MHSIAFDRSQITLIKQIRSKSGWSLRESVDFYKIHGEKSLEVLGDQIPEPINARQAFLDLYDAYVSHMKSEYDYPDNPWTPERDGDLVAIRARAALGL